MSMLFICVVICVIYVVICVYVLLSVWSYVPCIHVVVGLVIRFVVSHLRY